MQGNGMENKILHGDRSELLKEMDDEYMDIAKERIKFVPLSRNDKNVAYKKLSDEYSSDLCIAKCENSIENVRSEFRAIIFNPKNTICYITDDNTKIGYIFYNINESNNFTFLYNIRIFDEFQKKGYGTRSLNLLEEKMKENNIKYIKLHVFAHNKIARNLYKKLNYIESSINMVKEIDDNHVVIAKELIKSNKSEKSQHDFF